MVTIDHDRVLDLWLAGKTSRQVAAEIGLWGPEAARTVVQRARSKGDQRAIERHKGFRGVPHENDLRLEAEAIKRCCTVAALRKSLIAAVVAHDLFAAVLDDEG